MPIQPPESALLTVKDVDDQIAQHKSDIEALERAKQQIESGVEWVYSGAARGLLQRDGKPIDKAHLAHHIRAGRLAPIKIGNFLYFSKPDLARFVAFSPDYSRASPGPRKK